MKNIFLKETDKETNLYKSDVGLFYTKDSYAWHWQSGRVNQLIYITNNEEIKEGVYGIVNGQVGKVIITHDGYEFQIGKNVSHLYGDFYSLNDVCKKIVLTNDSSLIADGVQEVSSSFLSFYAENPVDYMRVEKWLDDEGKRLYSLDFLPKEIKTEENIIDNWLEKNGNPEIMKQVEREAEELEIEEAAEKYSKNELSKLGFLNGVKWQQEQDKKLYSEEDMEKSFEAGRSYHEHLEMQKAKYFEPDDTHKIDYKKYSFKEWFEQFKKK